MKIVIDSNEQLPYKFQTPSIRAKLPTGDYSLEGFEDRISIERKELNDLIKCLMNGSKNDTFDRDRFERELLRGMEFDYFAVVVEASLSDIVSGNYRSKMTPKSAIQSLLAFSVRYKLPIFFCDNRAYAQRVTESLLLKYAKELEKPAAASKET
jgi:ERCC4-type nuclease